MPLSKGVRAEGPVAPYILAPSGEPIRNAVVEIWQVDAKGSYLHSRGCSDGQRDANFQGFGRFLTGSTGFPGAPYPRAP